MIQDSLKTTTAPQTPVFMGFRNNMTAEQLEKQTMLLKINSLEDKIDKLTNLVHILIADRYPRFISLDEAARVVGVSRRTMSSRLNQGYYPFAFKENSQWKINLAELYKFQSQL